MHCFAETQLVLCIIHYLLLDSLELAYSEQEAAWLQQLIRGLIRLSQSSRTTWQAVTLTQTWIWTPWETMELWHSPCHNSLARKGGKAKLQS